jgi:GT2 family glycosyltransferase
MRPKALIALLESVRKQERYPDQILIVDGSTNNLTLEALQKTAYKNLEYFKVEDKDRGLTKQRNFGISKVNDTIDIVCFLDDDTILEVDYFKNLIGTYKIYPNAGGVGGFIFNEINWRRKKPNEIISSKEYEKNGWVRTLGSRNLLRKRLGLLSDKPPGFMPEFSNGLSVGFIPPDGNIHAVEYFMGGVSSFKKEVVDQIKFSDYFSGYGLYEDLEYCLRVSKKYSLYLNTNARLGHYHEPGGRPNQYQYGKMVVRNGWLVWRTRYSNPSLKGRFKWNVIVWVLALVKLTNVRSEGKHAIKQVIGRLSGWFGLFFNKPKS